MKPEASILISSHNRLSLLRRSLWALATRPPKIPFEVILADDGSTDDILSLLRQYSCRFPWKFISVSSEAFEKETGIKKFFNNPAHTNNTAFRHASGDRIFTMGNEVIAWGDVFNQMLDEAPDEKNHIVFSTTYDIPEDLLEKIEPHGSNLTQNMVNYCARWPLASKTYKSDVTNYLSLTTRSVWETIGGYDERYLAGIGKEDSDFVRRCRAIPGWSDEKNLRRSEALSLHQSHGGRTCYYLPKPEVISQERWREGELATKPLYDSWDGGCANPQPWSWGTVGVLDVITK